ncbi:cytochrome P450 6B5-like [Anticarsia gemmatalis]|uniref:cytochrome P450 6B5-like n=1 Tax=Anticarsia gemmatalis TaxID=129554 RepID=UPI003F75CF6B
MFLSVILITFLITLIFIYVIGNNNERYWKKRGIKFYSKNKVLGVYWDFFTKKGALFETFGELYNEYKKEPAIGIGSLMSPSLFVTNPKNMQQVLQADFNSFNHRGIERNEGDILADNIVFLNGPRWKLMRQSMSPLFTSAKLKNMYYIMDKSAQDLVAYMKEHPKLWEGDCYETMMTFCNASVCGAIFGIGAQSIFDSPFLDLAKKAFTPSFKRNLAFATMQLSPRLFNFLGLKLFKDLEDTFIGAITKVIERRKNENVKKHDFADLCINIQKNGIMKDFASGCEVKPTDGVLAAQALTFLAAGIEPVATVMFNTFLHLGRNPDILQKMHQEIDETFEKHNGKVNFDVINTMEYTDKVLNEAMRISPPLGYLTRRCVKDTVLPVGNIKVESGTNMYTPIYALHHDPDIYPEPDVFNPERFAKGINYSDEFYMPFGIGNRMCIGARYSKLQMAAGVVHVLKHFTVRTKKTNTDTKFKYHIVNVRPIDADVEFIPRNTK